MMTIASAYIDLARHHLDDRIARIRHCVAQLDDRQVWWRPHNSMNSIGNILLHLAGNMRQWIVSGVGDLPDTSNRPAEFAERDELPKLELMSRLTEVVASADAVLAAVD